MHEVTAAAAAAFAHERPRLLGLAYRMLGSMTEAEDTVQEAYLRWHRAASTEVRSPGAWLTTVVTRLCIDQLRSSRHSREQYVGTWLPEPILTDDAKSPAGELEMVDGLSMALLVLLERLSPAERAAFLLHDVFDYSYDEIAAMLGRSDGACRQLASRARANIARDRPRFEARDGDRRRLLAAFLAATRGGDYEALVSIFTTEAELHSDHGGKAKGALNTIFGADKIARYLLGIRTKAPSGLTVEQRRLNGEPALVGYVDGTPAFAMSFATDGQKIHAVYLTSNPDKLAGLSR